jgi:general secretion pathway protein A
MYLSHYKLTAKPFKISSDPKFLWLGEKHKEALATLKYGVVDNKGFLLLTGDVGTGKTTLINTLINLLDHDTIVATIPDPGLTIIDIYRFIAKAFNLGEDFDTKGEFINLITNFLHTSYAKKKKILLIIDEAQRLTHELLEELRLISNIEKQDIKLINIFFVGQPEFNDILLEERNRALRQRITINFDIKPLSDVETATYIKHRLKVAGANKSIFSNRAIQEVFNFSNGYPRLINIICDYALLSGYAKGNQKIAEEIITECAKELRITPRRQIPEAKEAQEESNAVAAVTVNAEAAATKQDITRGTRIAFAYAFLILLLLMTGSGALLFYLYPIDLDSLYQTIQKDKALVVKLIPKPDNVSECNAATESIHANVVKNITNPAKITVPEKITALDYKKAAKAPEPALANAASSSATNNAVASIKEEDMLAVDSEPATPKTDLKPLLPPDKISTIFFGLNSYTFSDDAIKTLDRIAAFLNQDPELKIVARGYTDNIGTYAYNKKLAEFRANIVKGYLIAKGVSDSRITTQGIGPMKTATQGTSSRRVEISIIETANNIPNTVTKKTRG